jgi:hypothetical protein
MPEGDRRLKLSHGRAYEPVPLRFALERLLLSPRFWTMNQRGTCPTWWPWFQHRFVPLTAESMQVDHCCAGSNKELTAGENLLTNNTKGRPCFTGKCASSGTVISFWCWLGIYGLPGLPTWNHGGQTLLGELAGSSTLIKIVDSEKLFLVGWCHFH